MGSASSKETDANPHDLGQNVSGMDSPRNKSQYPLAHHPQYGHTQSDSDNSMNGGAYGVAPPGAPQCIGGGGGGGGAGGAGGPHNQRQHHGDSRDKSGDTEDAMEVDQSSADLPYSSSSARHGDSEPSNTTSIAPVSDVVPMVFRWEHGGRNVYITGTFNGWSKQCPMHRSGNDFTYIANLTRGKHAYKFVVDEEWRFAPDQLTVADVEGNVNNFVDVSDFQALSDFDFVDNKDADENQYGRFIPDVDEYTKEPPPLPPHLRHIILNKNPPSVDTRLLPVPQHVALNHLYCTAIKDGMMVLGVTQRYKQKFVTTVYYSLMPGTS